MWVDSVRLVDTRAIRRCDVRLPRPGDRGVEHPGVTLLLGGHGVGKTTLLRAIAAATLPAHDRPVPGLDDDPGSWLRIGGEADTEVAVGLRSHPLDPPVRTAELGFTIARTGSATVVRSPTPAPPELLVLGYGADRTAPMARSGPPGGSPLDSLFGVAVLGPPDPGRLRAVLADEAARGLVTRLLPPDTGLADEREDAPFTSRGLPATWSALSDGVRSYLSWLLDVLLRLWEAADGGRIDEVPAVVLVDELDQRMHPDWQQSVVDQLATTLPAVQLVATAHSPLVAAGLRPDNLLLVEPDPGDGLVDGVTGGMVVERLREDLYGATADTTLTSSYFQLTSPRPVGFQQELRGLAGDAADSDEAALAFVRRLRDANPPPDRSPTRARPDRLRGRRP